TEIARDLAKARRLNDVAYESSEGHGAQQEQRIKTEYEQTTLKLDQDYKQVIKDAIQLRDQRPRQVDEKAGRVAQRNERLHKLQLERLQNSRVNETAAMSQRNETETRQFNGEHKERMTKFEADYRMDWETLETEWKTAMLPLCERIETIRKDAAEVFPEWDLSKWKNWEPPREFRNAAKFADLEIDLEQFTDVRAGGRKLPIPCAAKLLVPLCLVYPSAGSILLETKNT